MLYYLFDGTFPGLMTALFEAKRHKQVPENIIPEDAPREDLFGEYIRITTDEIKADRVVKAIKGKISEQALYNVIHTYLSDSPQRGRLIYHYLELGWKLGWNIDRHLTHESVLDLHAAVRKVQHECHRMLGLLRFQLLKDEVYYAVMEPDHNILGLIASHFAKRYLCERWLIHDAKRNIAARYSGKEWDIVDIEIEHQPELKNDELLYQSLWKEYFRKIAITERKNEKVQRQFMPKRYWKHLIETPGS
ncbi:MAG: DNA metabolism protein [bacterium]|nr:DNA metabolism protein [bacterium]